MVDPTRITRGTAPTRGTHTQWLAAETAGKIVPEGVLCISKDRLYSGSIEYFMGDGVNGYSKLSKQGNEWIAMSQTATRSSDYVFTVPGDLTGALKASRALRMNASSVVTVVSSAYASDITTVTVYGATLPASLTGWEMAKADVDSTPRNTSICKAALEYASGGRETVMYDNLGLPSVMVRIPAVTYKDVLRKFYADETAWNASVFKAVEGELLPAFKHNGSPIKALWIAKYMASIQQGRAVSLPGVNPSVSVTYDQARDYCQSKGSGWHLTTGYEWMAVTLVEMAMSVQPRGNTNWGRHHTNVWESGVRLDGGLPGVGSGDGRTLTGSGGKVWETQSGIADMVGNCWDWTHLLKLVDGKVYAPSDNYYDLAESSWPDTGVRFDSTGGTADGTGVTSGGAPVISNAITKYTGVPGQTATDYSSSSTTFTAITKKTGYTVPAIAYMLGLCPITLDGAAYEASNPPTGYSYQRNYGERLPIRGGGWNNGANAGLFYLYLYHPRSLSHGDVGFRPAFVEL